MSGVLSAWFLKVTLGTRSRLLVLFHVPGRTQHAVPAAASCESVVERRVTDSREENPSRRESRAYDSVGTDKGSSQASGMTFFCRPSGRARGAGPLPERPAHRAMRGGSR